MPTELAHAATRAGYSLPVIDVTDPRFAVPDDPQNVRALIDAAIRDESRHRSVPQFIMRLMLKSLTRRSLLAKALFAADAPFLDGLSTYVMKLGPDNLVPPYDNPVDRKFAASPQLTLLRLRTQQTARLLADGLLADLAEAPGAPLHLINIAGGPAVDSLNALILLRRHRPDLLQRRIAIDVFDGDEAGPYFGGNALAAMMESGRPLAGLDIRFNHHPYDWNRPTLLSQWLEAIAGTGAIVAASSEGGLFEYGSDDAIVENLSALRSGRVKLIAGSVTKDDEARRRMNNVTRFRLVPRGLHGFAPLAERGGFAIATAEAAHLSDQVALRPLSNASATLALP
ncbi:MAG: hypothetical protein GC182_11820 [Rhodopseudomonas sp.]|nr:hypothetical protein [Rhodopseudomonas sp.]